MNKKIQFLALVLIGLVVAQPSPIIATTPHEFAEAWRKALTCKALSDPEVTTVKGSLVGSTFIVGSCLVIYALHKLRKLHKNLREGIQEHDNELVSQTIVQMMPLFISKYIWTALYNDNHEALKILLERGVKPDLASSFSNGTPLCVALVRNDFESAHLLLDHGANPQMVNIRGIAPLFYAYKNEEVAQKMRSKIEERELKMVHSYNKWYCKKPLVDPSQKKLSLITRLKNRLNAAFKRKKEAA